MSAASQDSSHVTSENASIPASAVVHAAVLDAAAVVATSSDAPTPAAPSSHDLTKQPHHGRLLSQITYTQASTSLHRGDSNAPSPSAAQAALPAVRKLTYKDFEEGKLLGTGSYSTVRLCTREGKEYAMKIMEKKLILKEKKEKFAKMERDILNLLSHLNIVGMNWCFQDDHSLFFVLDYCSGGELFQQLRELGSLSLDYGTFVLAEIVCALSHIHANGIIHRDLKPENILFDGAGRIKVSDFGTACFAHDEALRKTFAGTAQYVSPEMLNNQDTCLASDLWALGCIIYQLFSGKLLFNGDSEYLTFQLIVADPIVLSFPPYFPPLAEQLVRALVVADPSQRLGVRSDGSIDYTIVRSHPFFASINWDNLHNTPPPPPAPLVSRDIIHPPPPPSDASSIPDGGVADASFSQADEERIQSDSQRYMRYLSQGERVMFCGKFKKKLLWDPATNVFKGEIPWGADLQPLPRTSTVYDIHGVIDAGRWIQEIQKQMDRWNARNRFYLH